MAEPPDVFEKNYQEYRDQMANIDFDAIKDTLGIIHDDHRMYIPFFNSRYFVSNNGITDETGDRPDYVIFVILSKYMLLCPDRPHNDTKWVSFKDFKRVSHFTNVNYFSSDTERTIERHFSGKPDKRRATKWAALPIRWKSVTTWP